MRKLIGFISVFMFVYLVFNNSDIIDTNKWEFDKSAKESELVNKTKLMSSSQWSEKKKRIKGVSKFDDPDKFMELHRMLRTQEGDLEPNYKMNYKIDELKKAKSKLTKLNKTTFAEPNWIERGPANVGGRTRGLLVDPDDPNKETWFVCAVGGGVWKTTDAGSTWELKTGDLPNIAMSYIAMAESNHNVLYVGTGEGFGNIDGIMGNGIFKSTDKGETWNQLSSTANNSDFSYVNRLVVAPSDENIVIVATNSGIFKTVDGGTVWNKVYTGTAVQDLLMNPLNSNSLYAAKNGNTVLKSLDAGDNWFTSSEGISGAGRLEIAIAPTDTNRLYISAETATSTLYISTNAGLSWQEVVDSEGTNYNWLNGQGWYDNAITVHPYNENIVFYGGIDIWKAEVTFEFVKGIISAEENSTNSFIKLKDSNLPFLSGGLGSGEQYWEEVLVLDNEYVDVEIRFGSGKLQKAYRFINTTNDYQDYVNVPFEVWDITNNKQLMVSFWDNKKNGIFNLSVFSGDNIFVHAIDYDSTNLDVNISQNNGLKHKNLFVVTPLAASGVSWDPSLHPESNIRILTGDVPISSRNSEPITDGYQQYQADFPGVSTVPHVDQHELLMIPINETTGEFRILNGNDGGVAYSTDGGVNWVETDQNGYNTSQFYGVDKKPGESEYFGGMQDNGTWQSQSGVSASASTQYNFRIGGDGFETAWHYTESNKLIGGSQYNRFGKSDDGGATFSAANNGFTGWANSAESPFISKIAKTNSDPDLLFTITRAGVWRTDDFAEKWVLSPISDLDAGGAYFSMAQVAISIANPQIVWAGSYITTTTTPNVSKDGGFQFSKVNNFADVNMGRISGLDTHPTDEATAYLTFSFADAPKILRTTDYGQNWEDISGFGTGDESTTGFPDVAVFCVEVMPYNTDIIWAGTDIGIVESLDGGASWHIHNSNLPAVSIWEMKVVDDEVVVATHGKGIWSASLPELSGYTPPVATLAPRINGDVGVGTGGISINATLRSAYDSTQVIVNEQPIKTILSTTPGDMLITAAILETGNKTVYLKSYTGGKSYRSSSDEVFVFEVLEPQNGFYSGFDSNIDQFVLDGFTIGEANGFSGVSLQSPHPYLESANYFAIIRTPIIVAESDAILSYRDVAVIEKGDPGTVFGDEEFWDYVVVEGSKGGEWVPLINGYDARLDSKWLTAYDGGQNGDESMFKNHSINLLDTFSANDTVLIRFRMFSDAFVVGWGWLVDDIIIQGQFVGVDEESIIPVKYSLNQNYPNPFNPSTTISFAIPKKSDVSVKIYNNIGQLVETLYQKETEVGYHNVVWDAKVASGVYYYTIKAGDFVQTKKMVFLK